MKIRPIFFCTLLTFVAVLLCSNWLFPQSYSNDDLFKNSLQTTAKFLYGNFNYKYRLKVPSQKDTVIYQGRCVFRSYSKSAFPKFNLHLNEHISYIFDGQYLVGVNAKDSSGVVFDTRRQEIGLDPIKSNILGRILENPFMDPAFVRRLSSDEFICSLKGSVLLNGKSVIRYLLEHRSGASKYQILIDTSLGLPVKVTRHINAKKPDEQYEEYDFSNISRSQPSQDKFSGDLIAKGFKVSEFRSSRTDNLKEHQAVPISAFVDEYGDSIKLEHNKEIYFLDFWHSQCAPCISAIPMLQTIQTKYKDIVKIISINCVDTSAAIIKQFFARYRLELPVILGNTTVSKAFKINSLPTFILVGKDLLIYRVYEGYSEALPFQISNDIEKLLN